MANSADLEFVCHICNRPIKLEADLCTRSDDPFGVVPVGGPSPLQPDFDFDQARPPAARRCSGLLRVAQRHPFL
jgi:hypothetical protein